MNKQTVQIKGTAVNITDLKFVLDKCAEVSAAYLFGSAASSESVVNDLDILILLHKNVEKNEVYIDLTYKLSLFLNISENSIDLLFFSVDEADLVVLANAVNNGILLKSDDPDYLSNSIDAVSRYLLENESMIIQARRLRQERLEVFCGT